MEITLFDVVICYIAGVFAISLLWLSSYIAGFSDFWMFGLDFVMVVYS